MRAGFLAPPTRREITITLFGLSAFVLSYNLDSSLRAVGVDSTTASSLSHRLGLSTTPSLLASAPIGPDGRRPLGWRDSLEEAILGAWDWAPGSVADGEGRPPVGEGAEYLDRAIISQELNATANSGAAIGRAEVRDALRGWGVSSVKEEVADWEHGIPTTRIVQHVAGFTVLDNVVFHEGVLYIVTDDVSGVPALSAIASSNKNPDQPPTSADWRIISTAEADEKFGLTAARIHGTTWVATGPSSYQDAHTLLALWRLHASLDPSITPAGHFTNPPPLRLFFPHIPTYTEKPKDPPPPVAPPRSYTGVESMLVKAALPSMSILHTEDWDDYTTMPVPFVFEHMLLADRGAAVRAAGSADSPPWVGPFRALKAVNSWLAPMRSVLVAHLGVEDSMQKKVVTYLSKQPEATGPKLGSEEHSALVGALLNMGGGVEVHVVDVNTPWEERMRAVVRSSVVLGPAGELLASSFFMKPSTRATIIELFPGNVYMADIEIPARAIGLNYIAWHNDKGMNQDNLPQTNYPAEAEWESMTVRLNAKALVKTVQEALSR